MKTRFLSAAALLGLCGLAQAQTTYDYVGPPIPILDGGSPAGGDPGPEAICTVNVSSHALVSDLNANFQINHTWQGDLRIRLVGPLGQTATLVARPGVPPPQVPRPRDRCRLLDRQLRNRRHSRHRHPLHRRR